MERSVRPSCAGGTRAEGPRGGGAPPRVPISPRSEPFCPAEAAVAPRCPGDRLVVLGRPRCGGCRRAGLPRSGPHLSPPRCLRRRAARPPRGLRYRSGTEAGSVTAPRRPSLPPGRGGGTLSFSGHEADEDEEEEEDGGGEELPAGDAAQDGGRCRDGYPGRPPPPRPLSASPRAEWGPAARPGSLLTRQLQELWRRSRSSLVPQRLLFEVTSASVVSERSSKYVVSASAGPQRRPRVRVGGRSLLSVSPRAALMAPRLR